ncbi:D-alanyl-D-alanine carboxypeptidase [Amycolatopsis sacchari]|uniref:D-alanyl-D-alanine carboxypeptidase n=1 Tax=Amycolatopsis sacchari TaxID=115433 RepID=A0A1I4BYS1_9PSEU|nr:serine hydrolase domain-containing protein [Amycolatopsis sacchari]SFK73958.1 D-alanyl-D-alanine carboxypeptidase [Amycolatopsis sacchari]
MTKNSHETATIAKKKRRRLRVTALVVATSTALAGPAAVSAVAAPALVPPTATDRTHNGPMQDVAEQVLGAGAPGYTARIDNGRRVAVTTAGVADRATGRPMTGRDQFEIGSNTKMFTSALALQLVDRGRLDLDAPVSKYLPGVVPNGENITVRMLLNHTSGLFSYTGDPDFFPNTEKNPQHVYTDQELLAIAFRHAADFAPGTSWSYSNTNYVLVGMILQKLTGKSMPELVEQRIVRPLGLTHTYYAAPRATHTGPGYAHGYQVRFAGPSPAYTDVSDWPLGGWAGAAGAIISTQADLSRFLSALLRGELFSRKQLEQMQTTVPIPASFGIPGSYGLGLIKIDSPCGTVWGHGGDTMSHHSTAVATADGRRTAISDTNAEPADTTRNDGVDRYVAVAFAAEYATICQMLDKPVPASVTQALHGGAPTTG